MSSSSISHKGRIIDIDPEFTSVEIISQAACSQCHAKAMCGISDNKTKIIQVPTCGWDTYKVGDEVQVALKASLGHKAVWLAYVIPLVILLAVLLGLNAAGLSELLSGLGAIGIVGLYYLALWILRKRIAKEYNFYIKND